MMKWLPTLLAALAAALTAIVPDVQAVVQDNPLVTSGLLALLALINALIKSPLGQRGK